MKNLIYTSNASSKGFTLVEMAIVLVIIGLILGMVFKGKELIDGAKVKSLAAQYNKILAATNTFYERYGFYPGDGCTTNAPNNVAECSGTKNGILENSEKSAYWHLLINITNILPAADRRSVFGQDWRFDDNTTMGRITITTSDGSAAEAAGDIRLICALDKLIDDGINNTGFVRSSTTYNANTDCWAQTGQGTITIKILP